MTAEEHPPLDMNLHLPSLTVAGFRGIEELSLPRMGRVTLLTGKNAVGKTTVLEAVQVYSAQDRLPILRQILTNREEFSIEQDREVGDVDWSALFWGRHLSRPTSISIGPSHQPDELTIRATKETGGQASLFPDSPTHVPFQTLQVAFRNYSQSISFHSRDSIRHLAPDESRRFPRHISQFGETGVPPQIKNTTLGPGMPSNQVISRFWDQVLTLGEEGAAVDSLRPILGRQIVDAVMTLGESRRSRGTRVLVSLRSGEPRVPLRSLGDGAVRLFGVALALANSRDGFLLIDEAENGIHHSVQKDYWRIILETAQRNNVQVMATTHSWDCVRGFAQAAVESTDVDGVLIRLERDEGGLYAIEYPEEELAIAAEQGIEVR